MEHVGTVANLAIRFADFDGIRVISKVADPASQSVTSLVPRAGHFMSAEGIPHERIQRAFAARQPPCGGTPAPRYQEWVFFEPALEGVFLCPQKAPPRGPPLNFDLWA